MSLERRRLRSVVAVGAAVGLAAAAVAALRAGAPERLELALYDARAVASAAWHPASHDVVLVAVDEETVRLGGGVHPLPRSALAVLVDEARRAGARVVAIDYLLQDPLEGSLADENVALETVLAGGGVVLAAALPPAAGPDAGGGPALAAVHARHARALGGAALAERFELAPPLTRFALAAAALGGVSQQVAENGRVYALRHVYPTAAGDYPSLPLAVAALASGSPPVRLERGRLRLGARSFPTEPDGTVFVRWYGPHDGRAVADSTYPEVSGALLLRARLAREGEGTAPPAAALEPLRGHLAIVCQTLAGTKDKQPTPVNAAALGGEVLANAVDNLLRGEAVRRPGRWTDAAVAVALSLLSALLVAAAVGRAVRPWTVVLASAATTGLLLVGWWWATVLALDRGLWLPALAPMAGALAAAFAADLRLFAFERQDRRFVHDALGRYTSPALVRTLLANRALLDRFGGAREELTVYFSDIRGFTSFSEGMDPEALVELLNEYLSTVTEVIERHGGYVDKYIGDAVMAIWGAPVPVPDHAARACAAALEIQRVVESRRPRWKERYGVDLRAGAGLNTGPMVAGNVGSRRKTNYTVLGETVNVASRLESATKAYGAAILVGDGTARAAGDAVVTRPIDLVRVKGQAHGLAIHELVALPAELTAADRARLEGWNVAVAAYRAGQLEAALAGFEAYAALVPGDGPCAVLAERCRAMIASPPVAGWDGVHVMKEK